MTEKIKPISNPLTVIAIFAALAEINATVSIGLVDRDLQVIFLWFVILFPTLLVLLFFITLNFNTEVIYAPSDYKDDEGFHRALFGENIEPDIEINTDKEIVKKTLEELGIKGKSTSKFDVNISNNVLYLFSIRYSLEKEVRRINKTLLNNDDKRNVASLLRDLVEFGFLTNKQFKAIRNVYSITSPAIHGEEYRISNAEIEYVKKLSPSLISFLANIQ